MARSFRFEASLDDALHTYRYLAEDERLFERNWKGLYGDWPEHGPTPYTEFAVNNNNHEELAVYLGLIWRLTSGLMLYGVPRFHRDAGCTSGEPYALINWEYEVQDIEDGNAGALKGFVPARSSVRIFPPPSPWQRENEGRAGMFEMPVFSVFRDVVKGLLGDASAELNVYAVKDQEGADRLVGALRAAQPPRMSELISAGEVFIDLKIGVDLGYADVIVIQSPTNLQKRLETLAREYEEAIEAYERDVDAIRGVDEFNARMASLLRLEDASQSRWAGWG